MLAKEEAVDKRSDVLEHRENKISAKEEQLRQREAKVEELSQKRVQELERISGLTSEQAKEYLLKTVEDDVKHDTAKMIRELETQAKEEADKKAKEYVVNAIQRCAADHVAETTISVVQLPSDEMKGRIIGGKEEISVLLRLLQVWNSSLMIHRKRSFSPALIRSVGR